jgi:hypothetical protein
MKLTWTLILTAAFCLAIPSIALSPMAGCIGSCAYSDISGNLSVQSQTPMSQPVLTDMLNGQPTNITYYSSCNKQAGTPADGGVVGGTPDGGAGQQADCLIWNTYVTLGQAGTHVITVSVPGFTSKSISITATATENSACSRTDIAFDQQTVMLSP